MYAEVSKNKSKKCIRHSTTETKAKATHATVGKSYLKNREDQSTVERREELV